MKIIAMLVAAFTLAACASDTPSSHLAPAADGTATQDWVGHEPEEVATALGCANPATA